jgi:hypothetical protein
MSRDIEINKPAPIVIDGSIKPFKGGTKFRASIEALELGKSVLITESYSDGISLLKELHKYLKKKLPNTTFQEQRDYRATYHKLSNRILIEINDQKIVVKKAPYIGWLEKFYSDKNNFLLTFPQIQGLNSAWQWNQNGFSVSVLRNKIHPYYGTYFPTRFEHLEVFENWLKRYEGPKKSAINIGFGSGILSMQMVKHGFQKIFGTDINPNAVVGLTEFMGNTKLSRKIELDHGHLFGKFEKETELIVFNSPWLPESHDSGNVDKAIYYDDKLFPEFFEEANQRLSQEGKLVLIFSNLAKITNLTTEHPIEQELAEGGRFKLEKCYKKSVKVTSNKTNKDQDWRSLEEAELWVLTKK